MKFGAISVLLLCFNPVTCRLKGFIVGGQQARNKDFPHSVFLLVNVPLSVSEITFVCGGSIINQRVVLTAGHCVDNALRIIVTFGNVNRLEGRSIDAKNYVLHQKYTPHKCNCDIGLIGLEKPLTFSFYVQRVVLMRRPPYEEKVQVAGWGVTNVQLGTMSDTLRYVNQTLHDPMKCYKRPRHVIEGTLCAISDDTLHHAAAGDSGSALVTRSFIQIGIVSCKVPGLEHNGLIYTDISYHYDWIEQNIPQVVCFK